MSCRPAPRLQLFVMLVALAACALPPGPTHALDNDTPFVVKVRKSITPVSQGGSSELVVSYSVFKNHFIYRDMSSVTVVDAAGLELGAAEFPKGTRKYDTISERDREIFTSKFDVKVPLHVPMATAPGPRKLTLLAKWQGCNLPKNYCLFPASEELAVTVQVSKAATAPRGGPPEAAAGADAPPAAGPPPAVSFAGLPASASFQELDPEGKKHPVHARLLADRELIVPGESFRLAVHLQQKEGWHTYWKSPGDVGKPTLIEWTLPSGWQDEPFEFPVPQRFEQEEIASVSYGYDDQVLFFSEVSVPADAAAGTVLLGAKVEWLVCEVSCIPGKAELKLPMKVGPAESSAAGPGRYAPLVQHFAAQHPVHPTSISDFAVEASLSVAAVKSGQPFKVGIRVIPTGGQEIKAPHLSPIYNGDHIAPLGADSISVTAQDDGSFVVMFDAESYELEGELPTGQTIGALLQVPVGDRWLNTEVSVQLPWVSADQEVARSQSGMFAAAGDDDDSAGDGDGTAVASAAAGDTEGGAGRFLWMLLLAFAGGILLNIMPCVLPVLTMKLYSLVEQQDISTAERRVAGVAYSAGIVCSFLALAGAVIVLRLSFGQDVLWGFQFQYPVYVAALAGVVWLFGLSLFGVFEVPAFGANQASEVSAREGTLGYFLTGVFATLLATPCTAPFLGTGMGFAFSLSTPGVLLFFAAAGLGLAFPFLVIAVVPALFRFLPSPGAWMETFKQLMGFTLVATTLWLVDVLISQVGADRGVGFLAFLLFVTISSWIYGRWGAATETGARQLGAFAVAVGVSVLGGMLFLDLEMAQDVPAGGEALSTELDFSESVPWQPFSEENLEQLAGTTVLIDFTADWCLTCKVNEKTILESSALREGMAELGVVPLMADWTRKDEVITKWLRRYGKAGVPFYLVVPADRSRANIALPEVITVDTVLAALRQAAD